MTNVSVTTPFGQALNHMGKVLFRPFDLGRWFVIGFCAWLAYLCESGGHGGGGFHGGNHSDVHHLRQGLEEARDYVLHNIGWLAPLVIGVLVVCLIVGLVLLWLSSRGQFMFLHCVALNTAEVAVPWRRYAAEARSLFLFRLLLGFLSMLMFLPMLALVAVAIVRMLLQERFTMEGVLTTVAVVLGMIFLGILFWIVERFLKDFVVPIQFRRQCGCGAAWREFGRLLQVNKGNFALYLLFRILIGLGISAAVLLLIVATCCLAGCLLILPYLGTVFLLPVLVFERSYSLFYLVQYGSEYDVFTGHPATSPGQAPPQGVKNP